jgi:hypothetical protein
VIPRRVTVDNVDDVLDTRGRGPRARNVRFIGLLFIGGLLAFGLWKTDLFGKWGDRGRADAGPTTTVVLGEGATIVDRTEAVGATWYLVVQPTTDGRLCYQIADSGVRVVFSCTGVGMAPMAPTANEVASVIIPPLAAAQNAPPVVMGSVAPGVIRIELRVSDVVQRIVPVDWPELGRNGFIAPIDPNLARALPAKFTAVAYDANGDCVGAYAGMPLGEMRLTDTKACPAR